MAGEHPRDLINAFRRIEIDEKAFNVDFLTEVGSMASVAVGLAMRRADDQ